MKKQSCNSEVALHLWSHAWSVVGLLQHEREHNTESARRIPLNAQCTGADPGKLWGMHPPTSHFQQCF